MIEDETIRKAAGRLLAWYEAMGVDAALADEPVDWLARGETAPGARFALPGMATAPETAPGPPAARPGAAPAPRPPLNARPPTTTRPARQFPAKAPAAGDAAPDVAGVANLAELKARLMAFEGCGLKATAKNLCLYRGAETAPLMIIGEAPGREEDLEGKPFVGRAGQLLDKMLASIGMDETNTHITNIVYWRPPGNRTPTPQEALACRPFLERQVALVRPKVVLALGGASAKHLFDTADGIMRIRGKWRELNIGGTSVKAMATLHPAYLLRTPAAKNMAWRDLLAVKAELK
ncbi:uracil-DNA glycosylase [Hyphomicrobium sp. 1Nfss2.1]|uniref:uracil-DNA glycosylase n=1 Tax=Hyphomicrobium sp. 1Nfss2.1 TaxID=3413936 RepID=UPI003C7C00FB